MKRSPLPGFAYVWANSDLGGGRVTMNAQDFSRYFQHPELLADLPMEEVADWVDRYPHVANLHLLLVLKAKREQHPNYEQYLGRLAAATFDRSHLYHLLHNLEQQVGGADILELRELDELALEALPNAPVAYEQIPSRMNRLDGAAATPSLPRAEERPRVPVVPRAVPPPTVSVTLPVKLSGWVDTASTLLAIRQPAVAAAPESFVGPQPADSFATVYARYQPATTLQDRLVAVRQRQLEQQRSSSQTVEPVVSETLAKLLVRQGQHGRAIQMYRRLALLYPEKKATFANLILQLKESPHG